MVEPIDFSKTKRIVLLVDLHPLLTFQNHNPNPYTAAVLAAAKRLLTFDPLSNSLFALKFFFSSLSPLRSASAVHCLLPNPALTSLSFDNNSQTLTSLSTILSDLPLSQVLTQIANARPCASHMAGSLLQLAHDYAWESELENLGGKDGFLMIRSNSVLLFSPVCRSRYNLSHYMDVDANNQVLNDLDGFLVKFCNVFGVVNNAFVNRDIYCTWIDTKCELEGKEGEVDINDCGANLGFITTGIRKMGWGFCSIDSIVLGSSLVPFGLIYPRIGVSCTSMNLNPLCKRSGSVQLSLGILDVNGKPLECNFCDLELLNLKNLPRQGSGDMVTSFEFRESQTQVFYQSETLCGLYVDGMTKLCVKAVQRYNEGQKIEGCSSDIILVRGFMRESRKQKRRAQNDLFADKVLNILSREMNELSSGNLMPTWQILMSFLYSEGYWALVSLSNSIGDAVLGILKPFTAHSGLLTIINNDCLRVYDCSILNFDKVNNKIYDSSVDTSNSFGCTGSQMETSTSGNCESLGNVKKKRNRKHLIQDLTWSSFCKAAIECSDFDLAAVYFARSHDQKKLKFLKCWLRQIEKYSQNYIKLFYGSKYNSEAYVSPKLFSEPSKMQEGDVSVSCSETADTFFNSLPIRIQCGLESGMNLPTLAERLVKSSIYWLHQTCLEGKNMEVQNPVIDDSSTAHGAELIRLLLRDPKEMKNLTKCNDPSAKSSDPNPSTETIVRQYPRYCHSHNRYLIHTFVKEIFFNLQSLRYELQVLLRMEILRSDISGSMEEPTKQKLLKQICSLLEINQYLIEGGIHGNISLYEYVERTIRTRYYDVLEDIVNKIYTQMDLLPFGYEDETRAPLLFNSEDSNQSWRDMKELPEKAEMYNMHRSVSTEDEPFQRLENVGANPEGLRRNEQARKLSEAQERRERARRFVSFTSHMPDLQRVWAPKQPKPVKGRSDSLQDSKRKDRKRASYSVVYETPMTGRKCLYSREGSDRDDEHKDPGNYTHSVSKALFQDKEFQ